MIVKDVRPDSATPQLIFGTGAGRCGTMALANLLNSEANSVCLHEGKIRHGEVAGKKVLPFLTLQNRQVYLNPEKSKHIVAQYRKNMAQIGSTLDAKWFGDIAYNYALLIREIYDYFPNSKIIIMFRNGYDFVKTATVSEGEDFTPIGWPPIDKDLSDIEKFISLGRLQPNPSDKLSNKWHKMDAFERNAWLWGETNRLILDQISGFISDRFAIIRYENFFNSLEANYIRLRHFLGFHEPMSSATRALANGPPINRRQGRGRDDPALWSKGQQKAFLQFAGPTMKRLGYSLST